MKISGKKVVLGAAIAAGITSFRAAAEEVAKGVNVGLGADLVSSYVWRGNYNAGASIQPTLGVTVKGFSVTLWGSTELAFNKGNNKKEVDYTLAYNVGGFKVAFTDYWWEGEGAFNYFNYRKDKTPHLFEGTLAYTLPVEKFPVTIAWNTIFAGNDRKINGDRYYSTYVELAYPFRVKGVALNAVFGFTPWKSPVIVPDAADHRRFRVCNIALGASKALKITQSFSLPVFTQVIWNPALDDVHLVFGLSLKY